MADVARRAGVSHSTASRAVNGMSNVSDEAREAVARAVRELGYIPDLRAADLARTRPRSIGLLVRDVERPFYGALTARIQDEVDERGVGLLIAHGGDTEERQLNALNVLLGHGVGGVLIASGRAAPETLAYAASFAPTACVGMGPAFPVGDWVAIDEADEADLARRVVAMGHRKVIVTDSDDPLALILRYRANVFREVLVEAGVEVVDLPGESLLEGAVRDGLLAAVRDGATAVMTGDDIAALHALEVLSEAGVRCPDDVSVTGFDGVGDAAQSPLLGIATVEQPVADLAREAVSIICDRMEGDDRPPAGIRVRGLFRPARTLGWAPAPARR